MARMLFVVRAAWLMLGAGAQRHFINHPMSADKLRSLGEQLRLGPRHEILDLASGVAVRQ